MFSNPPPKRKKRGHSATRVPKRPHRGTNRSKKNRRSSTAIPTVGVAQPTTSKSTTSRTIAAELGSLSLSDKPLTLEPTPKLEVESTLTQTLRRVTFADDGSQQDSDTDSQQDSGTDSQQDSDAGSLHEDNEVMKSDIAESSRGSPESEPVVDWLSSAVEKKVGSLHRYRVKSKLERSLDYAANRTMAALVHERENDVTRHIVINGDSGANRITNATGKGTPRFVNLRLWPNTKYHRYLSSENMSRYKPLGIDPESYQPQYGDATLEEPGMEWDALQLQHQGQPEASEPDMDQADGGIDYTGQREDTLEALDIADASVNGGIGLVIQRQQLNRAVPEEIEFLTKQQLMHTELQSPRYSRVPLPEEFRHAARPVVVEEHQSLVDITRVQVLNQILSHRQQPADPPQLPLSKFVSCTVANEAVSGILQTWSKIHDSKYSHSNASQKKTGAASTSSQWIAVLLAALAAGLPPQVVARSYYRLQGLCDTVSGDVAEVLASTIKRNIGPSTR